MAEEKLQVGYDDFILRTTGKTKEDRAREAREAENKVKNFFMHHSNPVTGEQLATGLGNGETIPTLCFVRIFEMVKEGTVIYDIKAKTWQAVRKGS